MFVRCVFVRCVCVCEVCVCEVCVCEVCVCLHVHAALTLPLDKNNSPSKISHNFVTITRPTRLLTLTSSPPVSQKGRQHRSRQGHHSRKDPPLQQTGRKRKRGGGRGGGGGGGQDEGEPESHTMITGSLNCVGVLFGGR